MQHLTLSISNTLSRAILEGSPKAIIMPNQPNMLTHAGKKMGFPFLNNSMPSSPLGNCYDCLREAESRAFPGVSAEHNFLEDWSTLTPANGRQYAYHLKYPRRI